MPSVASPQTSPREPALASILVRTERQVDWSRRRSSTVSMSSVKSTETDDGCDKLGLTLTDLSSHNKPSAVTRRRSVSFAPKTKLRPIPSVLEMSQEEIASIWQTPADKSQSITEIADTVRVIRGLKHYCGEEDISCSLQEDQHCERGIEDSSTSEIVLCMGKYAGVSANDEITTRSTTVVMVALVIVCLFLAFFDCFLPSDRSGDNS